MISIIARVMWGNDFIDIPTEIGQLDAMLSLKTTGIILFCCLVIHWILQLDGSKLSFLPTEMGNMKSIQVLLYI